MNVKSITEVINRTIHHKNQKHLRSNSKQKLLIDKTKVKLIEKQVGIIIFYFILVFSIAQTSYFLILDKEII